MASVKANEKEHSKEFEYLQYALGKKRVHLSKLHDWELDELISEQLEAIDFRRLRGFKELKDILKRSGNDPLDVSEDALFHSNEESFTLKSHVVNVTRGLIDQVMTYRRYETGEETVSREKAREWGRNAYIYKGQERLLYMRRVPELTPRQNALYDVTYHYDKIPNQNRHIIVGISADLVSVPGFCKHFGDKAPDVALNLLWELRTVYSQSVSDMRGDASVISRDGEKLGRLGHSIFNRPTG